MAEMSFIYFVLIYFVSFVFFVSFVSFMLMCFVSFVSFVYPCCLASVTSAFFSVSKVWYSFCISFQNCFRLCTLTIGKDSVDWCG